jgi:hypothetical protein
MSCASTVLGAHPDAYAFCSPRGTLGLRELAVALLSKAFRPGVVSQGFSSRVILGLLGGLSLYQRGEVASFSLFGGLRLRFDSRVGAIPNPQHSTYSHH